jgi:hypothetical protein
MTALVWLGAKATRRAGPSSVVVWLANGLAAVLFDTIHLPQASALFGSSAPVLGFVVGNGLPGLAFGWLYWRRGLLAATAAHSAADILMKDILPLVPFR